MKKLILAILISSSAHAATIQVNPGQTIASGISAAAAGDTVQVNAGMYTGGITLNKSVNVIANGAVTVNSTSPRNGTALSIRCNDCSVIGITFLDFGWAVSSDADWARVTIKNSVFRRSGTVWIRGSSWLFEGNEIDRPMVNGQPADVEDYMGLWGTGHTLRRNYFHGLNLSSDIPAGMHNDAIQMFTESGLPWQRLTNTVIDQNIFCDYLEAIWISNLQGVAGAIQNITVTNNVFWGQDFNLWGGEAVTSSGSVMFQSNAPGIVIRNNFFHHSWNYFSLYSMGPNPVIIEGNITTDGGNAYSLLAAGGGTTAWSTVNRGTLGNIFWQASTWMLPSNPAPDRTNVDPQYLNPAAVTGAQVVGPDGIPWTADDAWRTRNPLVALYGPQIGGSTPTNNPPTISISGPASPIQLAEGQTGANVTLNAVVTDEGVVTLLWGNGATTTPITFIQGPGTTSYTCTATDAQGLSATANIVIEVRAYVAPSPDIIPPTITLLGANPLSVTQNTTFTDPGATATDDRDGTVPVLITGTVNTAIVGIYTRVYSATDTAGNSAQRTRTVNVVAAPSVVYEMFQVRNRQNQWIWVKGTRQSAQPPVN